MAHISILLFFIQFLQEPTPVSSTAMGKISLQGKQSLRKILDELGGQTNQGTAYLIPPAGRADEEINLDWKNLSFWEALENLAKLTRTQIQVGDQIRLIPMDQPEIFTHLDGPFRMVLRRLSSSVELSGGRRMSQATLEIAWDPRLQPFFLETIPSQQRIVEEGDKLLTPISSGSSLAPVDGKIALTIEVPLPTPKRPISQLSLLEGTLKAIGPSKMAQFRFGSLDQLESSSSSPEVRQRTENGLVCRISRVKLNPDRWTVQVQIDTPPGGNQLESFQSWVVNNDLVLKSLDGKRSFGSSSNIVESVNERRAIVSYNFVPRPSRELGNPGDWQVSYTSPVSIISMPIRYRFRNIPLP